MIMLNADMKQGFMIACACLVSMAMDMSIKMVVCVSILHFTIIPLQSSDTFFVCLYLGRVGGYVCACIIPVDCIASNI